MKEVAPKTMVEICIFKIQQGRECVSDYFLYLKCQALCPKINPKDQKTKTNSSNLYNDCIKAIIIRAKNYHDPNFLFRNAGIQILSLPNCSHICDHKSDHSFSDHSEPVWALFQYTDTVLASR